MKKQIKYIAFCAVMLASGSAFAQNQERAGQGGADELLINPFTRSAGWGMANTTGVTGLESSYINIAGIAGTQKTEFLFSRTNYVADISINSFGFAHKLGGEKGASAFSMGLTTFNFGDFVRTTVDQPDGNLGTFRVSTSILSIVLLTKSPTLLGIRHFNKLPNCISPERGNCTASVENWLCLLNIDVKYEISGAPVSHWSWVPVMAI